MVMSRIFSGMIGIALIFAFLCGRGAELAGAVTQGAQSGIDLAIRMAGGICLWTGVGKLMEKSGFTSMLIKVLNPILCRVFPSSKKDSILAGSLSSNICANFLGLGNAATPMGIQAAQRLASNSGGTASDELCRLIVLNTASIQLIPATVASLRGSLGCVTPFDILPAVWITSICSAGGGLLIAILAGKLWRFD